MNQLLLSIPGRTIHSSGLEVAHWNALGGVVHEHEPILTTMIHTIGLAFLFSLLEHAIFPLDPWQWFHT